jgi:hypothetical protein
MATTIEGTIQLNILKCNYFQDISRLPLQKKMEFCQQMGQAWIHEDLDKT